MFIPNRHSAQAKCLESRCRRCTRRQCFRVNRPTVDQVIAVSGRSSGNGRQSSEQQLLASKGRERCRNKHDRPLQAIERRARIRCPLELSETGHDGAYQLNNSRRARRAAGKPYRSSTRFAGPALASSRGEFLPDAPRHTIRENPERIARSSANLPVKTVHGRSLRTDGRDRSALRGATCIVQGQFQPSRKA